MTDEQILAALDRYERLLLDTPSELHKHDTKTPFEVFAHLTVMIPAMVTALRRSDTANTYDTDPIAVQVYHDKREKLMRWLGFIQGVLWTRGVYTVDALRAHIIAPVPNTE